MCSMFNHHNSLISSILIFPPDSQIVLVLSGHMYNFKNLDSKQERMKIISAYPNISVFTVALPTMDCGTSLDVGQQVSR